MDDTNKLYVEEFAIWLHEQTLHTESLAASVENYEKIKQCNAQQLILHKKRINHHIDEYNTWAKAMGERTIDTYL